MEINGFKGTYIAPTVTTPDVTAHIHRGKGFEISAIGSLLATQSITLIGVVGDIPVHFHAATINTSAGPLTSQLIEAPTVTVQGTPVVPVNKNRVNPIAATMAVYTGGTVTGGTVLGTRQIHDIGGGAHTEGGDAGFATEWVLAPNTTYAIRFTAGADLSYSALMFWYEIALH